MTYNNLLIFNEMSVLLVFNPLAICFAPSAINLLLSSIMNMNNQVLSEEEFY